MTQSRDVSRDRERGRDRERRGVGGGERERDSDRQQEIERKRGRVMYYNTVNDVVLSVWGQWRHVQSRPGLLWKLEMQINNLWKELSGM